MAKWGEGDPRWIVEERPDAVNVNNWHWTEKNATPWSKTRIKELLVGKKCEQGPISIEFAELKKLEGEATANNRKAKLIFLYEWVLELKFIVRLAGSSDVFEGYIEVLNLSDEYTADELDINLTLDNAGDKDEIIRQFFHSDCVKFIRNQLAAYIRELKEEFSKGLILPTANKKPQVLGKGDTCSKLPDSKSFKNNMVITEKEETKSDVGCSNDLSGESLDTTTVTVSQTFKVQPDQLWEVLTDPVMVCKWTNCPATIDLRENGNFSLYNGMVSGSFTKIERPLKLEMNWRMKTYPANHHAKLTFSLKDTGDSTELEMLAKGVPSLLCDETKNGLQRFYAQNICRTFGFDARIL